MYSLIVLKIFNRLLNITFIYFREKGREGEREGEKHQCESNIDRLRLVCAPAPGRTGNSGMYPDQKWNQ